MPSECVCPDPYCPVHARCGACGSEVIITGDPAFCPSCFSDVMPVGACSYARRNAEPTTEGAP